MPKIFAAEVNKYKPPAAVTAYYAELDRDGARACLETAWWQALRASAIAPPPPSAAAPAGKQWLLSWPSSSGNSYDPHTPHVHRQTTPLHFALGRLSPFYIERMRRADAKRAVWAVYFGPATSNGSYGMGVGQGGAIATIFDVATAQLASLHARGRVATAWLDVRMRRPVAPVPGVYRVEAWIVERNESFKEKSGKNGKKQLARGRRIVVEASLTNAKGAVCDTCVAELVRAANPMKAKARPRM